MLKGKNILIGITGAIAAYKILELIRLLKKNNANVKVVVTPNALNFVTKTTLESLSQNSVDIKQFEIDDEKEELELFKDACRLFATGEEPENQEILEYLKQSSSYDKILEALPDLRCQLSAVPDNILACGIYCWLTGKSTRRVSALYI